jgi:hypothetical protein
LRFIPTKFHAPLDYIVGAALIAAPWIFQFSEHTAATVVPIVLGIGLIAYSLFTNYELGLWKVAPMAVHNLIDIAAGGLLAASPWIFGFADESAGGSAPEAWRSARCWPSRCREPGSGCRPRGSCCRSPSACGSSAASGTGRRTCSSGR